MNMLYEAIKEKGSMVIVPSSAVETMDLGGLTGVTVLVQKKEEGRRMKDEDFRGTAPSSGGERRRRLRRGRPPRCAPTPFPFSVNLP